METIRKPRNIFLFLITVVTYIVALIAFGFWDYTHRKYSIMQDIDTRLFNSAASLKYILPDDFHDRAVDRDAIQIPEDRYNAHKFTEFIKETGFKYAYTIVKKGDKLFFIASDIAADPKSDRGTYYFYPYEEADEIFFKAFNQNTPQYKTVSDQWGTVRTVMIPETSPGGVKYLACSDYDIGYVDGLLQKNLLRSFGIVLFFLIMSGPIAIIYSSSLKSYLDALGESEEKYRDLIGSITDFIYSHDLEGRFTMINRAAAKTLGYIPEDLIGRPISDYMLPKYRKLFKEEYLVTIKENGFLDGVAVYLSKDGSEHFIEYRSVLVKNEAYESVVNGSGRDITEKVLSERKLKRLQEQLHRSQKMEALGLMAGGIAHDLNNILSGIVSYPELLLMDLSKDSPLRKPIETIKESGIRAANVVSDLLTVARGVAISKEVRNLNVIIEEYMESIEHEKLAAIHPSVVFKTKTDPNLFNINCSPTHIKKCLMNLATNASEPGRQ